MENLQKKSEQFPVVSVITALRNEKKYIRQCLESLICQDYPKDRYEIIIINGMSIDGSREIVLEFQRKYKNIFLLDNPKRIYSSALNIGVTHARGSIIIKVDAHVRVTENFISKNVEYLIKTGAACVGGVIETRGEGFIGEAIALILNSFLGTGGAKFRYNHHYEGYTDTVPFGAYQKKVFDEVGLYNEKFVRCEDLDLHRRIKAKGGKFFITPKIKSYYYCRNNIDGFIRQQFANGYEVMGVLDGISLRHIVPFFFVVSLLVSLFLARFSSIGKIIFGLIILSYLFIIFIFSLIISFQKGWKYFLILPFLFFILHFSYGLGSVWGLLIFKKIKT